MDNILEFAKKIVSQTVSENPVFVDFTMGNGNDTLYLLNLSENAFVYAFDIQKDAITNTEKLLKEHNKTNYQLILDSHANILQYVDKKIDAGMFNLGYLPKGDKSITTKWDSTIKAIEDSLTLLKVGGVLCIAVYIGHDEGAVEGEKLLNFAENLNLYAYNVIIYKKINHKSAPYILAIEKTKEI